MPAGRVQNAHLQFTDDEARELVTGIFANVPVFDGGSLRMVAGMGNAPDPYTDADVEAVQLVADAALRNDILAQAANQARVLLSRFDGPVFEDLGRFLEHPTPVQVPPQDILPCLR